MANGDEQRGDGFLATILGAALGGQGFLDRRDQLREEERLEEERKRQRELQAIPVIQELLAGLDPQERVRGAENIPLAEEPGGTLALDPTQEPSFTSGIPEVDQLLQRVDVDPQFVTGQARGFERAEKVREEADFQTELGRVAPRARAEAKAQLDPEVTATRQALFKEETAQGIQREKETFAALAEQRQTGANERFREFVRQTDYSESVRQAAEAGQVENLAGIADLFGVQAFVELADDAEAGTITDPLTFLGEIVENMSEVTGLPVTDPKQLDAAEDALHRYHPFFNDVPKIAQLIQSSTSLQTLLENRGAGFNPFSLSNSTESAIDAELRRRGAQ